MTEEVIIQKYLRRKNDFATIKAFEKDILMLVKYAEWGCETIGEATAMARKAISNIEKEMKDEQEAG